MLRSSGQKKNSERNMVKCYWQLWKRKKFKVKRKEAHNIIRCEKIKYVQNIIKEAELWTRSNEIN